MKKYIVITMLLLVFTQVNAATISHIQLCPSGEVGEFMIKLSDGRKLAVTRRHNTDGRIKNMYALTLALMLSKRHVLYYRQRSSETACGWGTGVKQIDSLKG